MTSPATHGAEPHASGVAGRLNWLRAGVLGANDGIVSVAAVVVGVAGATPELGPIVAAGSAALIGGAISMALGEYVSVSSQRDSESSMIRLERRELAEMPEAELAELAELYEQRGLRPGTARRVAEELTAHDALRAHLEVELGIDPDDIVNPWHAAVASAIAFTVGALLPFTAILAGGPARVPITVAVVMIALAATGALGARLGRSPMLRPTVRVLLGGALALGATYLLGTLLGTVGAA
jgi:VIT1/CCC1 family predicted Fe2+/Mn2+ transporter